jgi:RNA ligase (TIGR02306 family)
MSKFEAPVVRIRSIEPIPGADAIELAVVGDYRSVVRKGQMCEGQLAVYIPEASIIPPLLLRALGLEGKLAGSDKNRVKAIKLRGCLSQGIVFPVDSGTDCGGPFISIPTEDGVGVMLGVQEGQDVAADLGITKWEPPIPVSMAGEVYYAGHRLTVAFDIENFKKYPDILVPGEEVIFTEKLHGTFCGVGIVPVSDADPNHFKERIVVFSKGLGSDGLCFKDNERNKDNIYVKTLRDSGVIDRLFANFNTCNVPLFILGEVFGTNVQDLGYGCQPSFRVFAAVDGYRGSQRYRDWAVVEEFANILCVDTVPLLYKGPFSRDVMEVYTSGKETVSGKMLHMREGIVITPTVERGDTTIGRVILKSVSEAYLTRKGNVTEFQ